MNATFEFETLADFMDHFHDEETCRKHFTAIRFGHGEYCPHCGHKEIYTFNDGKRYRCADCKRDFTIKTGTVFGESKLPIRKWFVAIYLLSTSNKGISSVQLAKQVGVTQKTGWFMDHRIRRAMKQNDGQLFGTVEIDETYIGGKEKNRHAGKRTEGTQGRSTKTKVPVVGMIQRDGDLRAHVVERVTMAVVEDKIKANVDRGAQIMSDDFLSYDRIGRSFSHQSVSHGAGEYARGAVHTNGIESFWALFKRGYHGVYHQMSKKHLQRYLDESVFRFNRRLRSTHCVFSDVMKNIARSAKLPYKELTA